MLSSEIKQKLFAIPIVKPRDNLRQSYFLSHVCGIHIKVGESAKRFIIVHAKTIFLKNVLRDEQ